MGTLDDGAPPPSESLTASELAARFGDAVFRVEVRGCGLEGQGTAFAVSSRHLVTNQHVVAPDVRPVVRSRDGRAWTGRVIGWREDPDVAVIEVTTNLPSPLEWGAASELAEGDDLVALGYPLPQGDFAVVPGTVLSFQHKGTRREAIRSDAAIDYGHSGGPALTREGTVAGVATRLAANPGLQYVPLFFTAETLEPVVRQIIANPSTPAPDCVTAGVISGASPEPSGDVYEPLPPYGTWVVILASIDTTQYSLDYAESTARAHETDGVDVALLLSDLYPSLNPGYWVVYSGVFLSESPARQHCLALRETGIDCYQRYLGTGE